MNDQLDIQFFCAIFLLASVGALSSLMLSFGASQIAVVWLVVEGAIFSARLLTELV